MLFSKKKKKSFNISLASPEILNEEAFSENWLGENLNEGRLSLDVYNADDFLIIKAPVAGAILEELEVSLHNDMLTIRGRREAGNKETPGQPILKECYWGVFSRSIVLPCEVDARAEAYLESGILSIKLKKIFKEAKIKVKLK